MKWQPMDGRFAMTAAGYELKEKNRLSPDPNNLLNSVQRGEALSSAWSASASAIITPRGLACRTCISIGKAL